MASTIFMIQASVISSNDEVLKEAVWHNAIYTCKTIQNEMIVIYGDFPRNKILNEVRETNT